MKDSNLPNNFHYINDLINSSDKFTFLMYADDTTLYFNLQDFPDQNRSMLINNEFERVKISHS